jgi:hypothetical protein
VRSPLDHVEELLMVSEGVPNPVRDVLDLDDENVNSVIKSINWDSCNRAALFETHHENGEALEGI